MDFLSNLPHDWIATIAAALGTFLFTVVGLHMLMRMYRQYEKAYLEGTATTLDAMYVTMPAQNILYLGILCFIFVSFLMGVLSRSFLIGVLFGLPTFFVPRAVLYFLKTHRDELFNVQLVDALMNISNSLRAGFSLNQALDLVHREMPNPISQEFRLVCQELRLGLPMEEALENLYRRMPLPDVDLVVTAIAIVRDVGGNLTEVFDNIAHTIRERHRIEGKIRALTAQGKLQAIVVCLIPFVLGGAMYVVAPDLFAPMITTPLGWAMIAACLVLIVLGWLWIRKIVAIDV